MSATFFKATRPDGTDFWTGKVRYEVGKVGRVVRPAAYEGTPSICGPGFLHAADVPAETLVGGRWPCRLFEVSGMPAAGFDARYPHKGGFRQLKVVREIDAHLALGPNGREVAVLIDRVGRLTPEEAKDLTAARAAARAAAWDAARDAAACAAWAAARAAARAAAGDAAGDAAGTAARAAARTAAWTAARALVVRDLIPREQFDVLYGPWASVMEVTR